MQDDASDSLDWLLERLTIEEDEEIRSEIITRMIHLIHNGLSIYDGKGFEMIKAMHECLKDNASFDEQLLYVQELKLLHFGHDEDVKQFMTRILSLASLKKKRK